MRHRSPEPQFESRIHVPQSYGLQHAVRHADGTATGVWGPFEIRSAFQPIFRIGPDERLFPAAYEGLVRPFRDHRAVSPYDFFRLVPAESRFEVEGLLRAVHLLNAASFLPAEADIFLNFDPSVIVDEAAAAQTIRDLKLVLEETAIPPRRIVCEMTEQPADSVTDLANFAEALRGSGFRIAVDDYGADESDAARVRALRPDIVKFDGKWANYLLNSRPGMALLQNMVSGFREKGIVTVFEGIEFGYQLDLAVQAGTAMVQGFALARPQLATAQFSPFPMPEDTREATLAVVPVEPKLPQPADHTGSRPFGRRNAS